MTSSQLTQCPKCQTSFRITSTQLRAAAGSVRCGSCLEVFDARDHMVKNESDSSVEKEDKSSQKTEKTHPSDHIKVSKNPPSEIKTKQKPAVSEAAISKQVSLEELNAEINLLDTPQHNLDSIFSHLETEHIEVEEKQEHKKVRAAVWITILTTGLLGLMGQYVWFNKDQLATNLKLRPAYTFACQLLDCKLPALTDLQAIKSMQLLVRSIPDQPKGLVVDSIIINEAPFAQPWPRLKLVFSNLNGQIVASRTFRPSEYLGGTLAGSREIPSRKPVRLSLEIVDPGKGAVNYQLNLL